MVTESIPDGVVTGDGTSPFSARFQTDGNEEAENRKGLPPYFVRLRPSPRSTDPGRALIPDPQSPLPSSQRSFCSPAKILPNRSCGPFLSAHPYVHTYGKLLQITSTNSVNKIHVNPGLWQALSLPPADKADNTHSDGRISCPAHCDSFPSSLCRVR